MLIVLMIAILVLALVLYACETNIVLLGAIGGVIASGFWLLHVWKENIEKREFEFLAAFTWMIFSIISFSHL